MTSHDFFSMLDRMADAWRSKRYQEVAERFSDDAYYCDPLSYELLSRDEILAFFQAEEEGENCTFHNAVFDEGRQIGVAEYSYSGSNTYHGTVWVKLEDEKIVEWREYQHKTTKPWSEFWTT